MVQSPTERRAHEAAQVHVATWRRGGGVADCGAGAAHPGCADRLRVWDRQRRRPWAFRRSIAARNARAGLRRWEGFHRRISRRRGKASACSRVGRDAIGTERTYRGKLAHVRFEGRSGRGLSDGMRFASDLKENLRMRLWPRWRWPEWSVRHEYW